MAMSGSQVDFVHSQRFLVTTYRYRSRRKGDGIKGQGQIKEIETEIGMVVVECACFYSTPHLLSFIFFPSPFTFSSFPFLCLIFLLLLCFIVSQFPWRVSLFSCSSHTSFVSSVPLSSYIFSCLLSSLKGLCRLGLLALFPLFTTR